MSASTQCLAKFARFLSSEASKTGIAPSNAFVLTEWCSIAFQICAGNTGLWRLHEHDLVTADAQLIELCLASSVRDSVKKSALVVTRRALRKIFKSPENGKEVITSVVSQLSEKGQLGYRGAVLLGIVAGVCSRLPDRKPTLKDLKSQYLAFWVREIVGSRSTVPSHISNSLNDFFSSFVSAHDLETAVVPALEKALLRAPEVVLNDLIRPVIVALPSQIDLADILANHLLKPLLSNVKSSNAEIRNGALSTFAVLVDRSHNERSLEKVSKDILTPLVTSKLTVADQRVLHGKMLALLPYLPSSSLSICDSLVNTVSKEPNELALSAEANAITHHLFSIIASGAGASELRIVIDAFVKGLNDKRPAFQKLWALRSGNLFWQLQQNSVHNLLVTQAVEAILPNLLSLYKEAVSNPLLAVQTGIVMAGHIVTSLNEFLESILQDSRIKSILQKTGIYDQALASTPKPSFLLNHKVYTKFSTEEDLRWAVRAVASCAVPVCAKTVQPVSRDAWSQSLLYLITAASVAPSVRNEAVESLREVYMKQSLSISRLIIQGLWIWYRNIVMGIKDSAALAAQTGTNHLYLVVRSICPTVDESKSAYIPVDDEQVQVQLVEMLVLCRPEILPRITWIELCLRIGQDPGAVVRTHSKQCMEYVKGLLDNEHRGALGQVVESAAYNTFAELAFVAPDVITPLLVELVSNDLNVGELGSYGPTDFAIARTPEGTAFVDVLSKKNQNQVLDKNTRDYDTLKWEEEIRNQVAQKKGQGKRLTPDEQGKVNAQLFKEATIREKVHKLEKRLRRGIGVISGLARGPPTDADIWMGPCVRMLLDIVKGGIGNLVGDAADQAFVACSNFVSLRLGSLRSFIGVATLRALGSSHLPSEFVEEPLRGKLYTQTSVLLLLMSSQIWLPEYCIAYV